MSTHNICFHEEISKVSTIFCKKKKKTYLINLAGEDAIFLVTIVTLIIGPHTLYL